jgi:outer membrane lipoprotein carrier protein
MFNSLKICSALLLWLDILPPTALFADTTKVDELIQQIDSTYLHLQDLQMNFKKEMKSEVFKEVKPIKGVIYLKQPDKFRMESSEEIIVSDGQVVWTYTKELQQVTKQRVQSGQEFNFLSFLEDIQTKYEAELLGAEKVEGAECKKMLLTPKERGTDFEKLTLWVDGKSYLIRKMELQDLTGNKTRFWFTEIKINPGLQKNRFEFKPTAKVELIDLTEQNTR